MKHPNSLWIEWKITHIKTISKPLHTWNSCRSNLGAHRQLNVIWNHPDLCKIQPQLTEKNGKTFNELAVLQ